MSSRHADQPRAKRRRCAPKRYAEQDDASSNRDETAKSSPESSIQQQQQQHRTSQYNAPHAASLSWDCNQHARPAEPEESEEGQALRVIQKVAMKLSKQDRPHLKELFSQTKEQWPRLPTVRYNLFLLAVHLTDPCT